MLQSVVARIPVKRWIEILAVLAFYYGLGNGGIKAQTVDSSAIPQMQNVLCGASYYHEYEPYERLDQDVKLMKDAGLTVVRMGESTWSLGSRRMATFSTHGWIASSMPWEGRNQGHYGHANLFDPDLALSGAS